MATPGTWQTFSYDGMQYQFLLPDDYNPAYRYPVLLFLHGGGEENLLPAMIDPWFNTAAFRSAYPAIVIAPQLPNSSATVTWGGYPADGTVNSVPGPNSAGENQALAILQNVLSNYAADPNRVYVTGLSLGGHGTWDLMIKYNAYDGPDGRIFAAGLSLSGAEGDGGEAPTPAEISELANVPIWAIHGVDGAQNFDLGMAAEVPPGSAFHLTYNDALGHDVWDTYYPLPNGAQFYNWMFSQSAVSGQSYSISAPTLTVAENAGLLTFTVTRTDLRQAATVYVSTAADQGSANDGAYNDLTAVPVSFAPDQPTASLSLTINDLGLTTGSGTYSLIVQSAPASSEVATTDFTIQNTDTPPACFRRGTQIMTVAGNVPVERLRSGDRVLTALGVKPRPVTWIGHRRIDCTRHPNPCKVLPIAVAPHAFGPGLPQRTLFLSPDHAVLLDGALIPIRCLVNGTTIRQSRSRTVTYYHVELTAHDVVFAEGLPVESYLDVNDRADFTGGPVVTLHPDFATRVHEANGCAPLLVSGPAVEAARIRLAATSPRTASGRT